MFGPKHFMNGHYPSLKHTTSMAKISRLQTGVSVSVIEYRCFVTQPAVIMFL